VGWVELGHESVQLWLLFIVPSIALMVTGLSSITLRCTESKLVYLLPEFTMDNSGGVVSTTSMYRFIAAASFPKSSAQVYWI
jgi:hypothetical protein